MGEERLEEQPAKIDQAMRRQHNPNQDHVDRLLNLETNKVYFWSTFLKRNNRYAQLSIDQEFKTRHSYIYMLHKAGQTAEPIGLKFFVDTH